MVFMVFFWFRNAFHMCLYVWLVASLLCFEVRAKNNLCLFLSEQLQRTYQEKYDALVERERNSIERLQKEQEVSDHSVIV